jgi:branched-subunit amino acid transport protein
VSPRQIADDPGRQIRKPYLGPKGMRFPFDWTLEEMALAFTVLLVGMVLLVFVVPAGIVVAWATWVGGRSIAQRTSPDSPRRRFRLIAALVAVVCLVVSANPMTWIRPAFLPVAFLAALALPILVVRGRGRYLDWNRPFGYWLRLPRLVASGPRLRPAIEVNVAPLMLTSTATPVAAEPLTAAAAPVTATPVIAQPLTGAIVEKRLVPLTRQPRHKMIERTAQGFRVGRTEYRVEWTI